MADEVLPRSRCRSGFNAARHAAALNENQIIPNRRTAMISGSIVEFLYGWKNFSYRFAAMPSPAVAHNGAAHDAQQHEDDAVHCIDR
jgi:hypothetical protein